MDSEDGDNRNYEATQETDRFVVVADVSVQHRRSRRKVNLSVADTGKEEGAEVV